MEDVCVFCNTCSLSWNADLTMAFFCGEGCSIIIGTFSCSSSSLLHYYYHYSYNYYYHHYNNIYWGLSAWQTLSLDDKRHQGDYSILIFMQDLAQTWSAASQLVNNRCLDYSSVYTDMYVWIQIYCIHYTYIHALETWILQTFTGVFIGSRWFMVISSQALPPLKKKFN